MPQLPDPSNIRSRPASVAVGELAVAAGLLGESLTTACDFPASTLCQIWRYYSQALGPGNTIHVRAKKDIKDLEQRLTGVRAVFVNSATCYYDVAWLIQMAGSDTMSPRPAVFCGFQHDDPDADPGITVPLTNDEQEVAAIHNWAASHAERHVVEVECPASVSYASQLEDVLQPSALERVGIGFREQRIAAALSEGTALLGTARVANEDGADDLQVAVADYEFVRGLLCSPVVRPNRELCEPLALDMLNRTNVYLAVKLSGDRGNPFWAPDEDGYRRSRESSLKRDAITRRELADLGNVHSRVLERLIEYLQRSDAGYPHYLRMGCSGQPIAEGNWTRSPARDLAGRLKSWSIKQVRSHFDRLHQRGLISAERQQANGPIHYAIPEELADVLSPYSQLPTLRPLRRNQPAA